MRLLGLILFILFNIYLIESANRTESEGGKISDVGFESEKSETGGAQEKSDVDEVIYDEYEYVDDGSQENAISRKSENVKENATDSAEESADSFPNEVFLSLRNITADAATAFRSFTNRNDVVDLQASASDNLNVTTNGTLGDTFEAAGINLRALRDAGHPPEITDESPAGIHLPYKHAKIDTADLSDCALQGEWKPMGVAHGHLHQQITVGGDNAHQAEILQSIGSYVVPNKIIPHWHQNHFSGSDQDLQEVHNHKPSASYTAAGAGNGYGSGFGGGGGGAGHGFGSGVGHHHGAGVSGFSGGGSVSQFQKFKTPSMLSPPPVPPIIFGKKPGYWKTHKPKHKYFYGKGKRPAGFSGAGGFGFSSHVNHGGVTSGSAGSGLLGHGGGHLVSGSSGHLSHGSSGHGGGGGGSGGHSGSIFSGHFSHGGSGYLGGGIGSGGGGHSISGSVLSGHSSHKGSGYGGGGSGSGGGGHSISGSVLSGHSSHGGFGYGGGGSSSGGGGGGHSVSGSVLSGHSSHGGSGYLGGGSGSGGGGGHSVSGSLLSGHSSHGGSGYGGGGGSSGGHSGSIISGHLSHGSSGYGAGGLSGTTHGGSGYGSGGSSSAGGHSISGSILSDHLSHGSGYGGNGGEGGVISTSGLGHSSLGTAGGHSISSAALLTGDSNHGVEEGLSSVAILGGGGGGGGGGHLLGGSSGYLAYEDGSAGSHLTSATLGSGGGAGLAISSHGSGGGGNLISSGHSSHGVTAGGDNLVPEAAFLSSHLSHGGNSLPDSTFSSSHINQGVRGGNSLPDAAFLSSHINQDFAVHGQGISDDLSSSSTFTCGKNHDHNTNYHTATFQVADHDHPSSVDVLQYGGDSAVLIKSGNAPFQDQLLPERKLYKTWGDNGDTEVSSSDTRNELTSQAAQLTSNPGEQEVGQTEAEQTKADDGEEPERHSYYHEITKVTKIPATSVGAVQYTYSEYETKPQSFSQETEANHEESEAEQPQIIRELEHLSNKFQLDIENPQKLFEDPPTQEVAYHYPFHGVEHHEDDRHEHVKIKEEQHEGITEFPHLPVPVVYHKRPPIKYIPRPGKPQFYQKTAVNYLQPKAPVVVLRKTKPKQFIKKNQNYEVQEHGGERHRPVGEIFPPQKFPKQFHNPKPNFAVDRPKNGWRPGPNENGYQDYKYDYSHGKSVKKFKHKQKIIAPVLVRRPVQKITPVIRVVEVSG